SVYGQTVATMAGVNAIHCQKLRTEENDLMKAEILEEAKLMVTSFNGLSAHTSYVSSRKEAGGIMDKMVENARASSMDCLISCYKDSAEGCPVERRGDKAQVYEVRDIFNLGQELTVTA